MRVVSNSNTVAILKYNCISSLTVGLPFTRSLYPLATHVIDVHYSYCDKPVNGQLVILSTFSGAALKCQYKKVSIIMRTY